MRRALDILIPTYNRPAKLYALLKGGVDLAIDGVYFVVIDDGSSVEEEIDGLGRMSTQGVCEYFKGSPIVYMRNDVNVGLACSWDNYFKKYSFADYYMSVVDKDRFVDGAPIRDAIEKLDSDPSVCMIFLPILEENKTEANYLYDFCYPKLSGPKFVAAFVRDPALQHAGGYAIKRLSDMRKAGVPRNMRLARYGLQDMFGIDIDLVLRLAAQGNVDFVTRPHMKMFPSGGMTERNPLSFAYTYYQYAKRVMAELAQSGNATPEDVSHYLGWWHLLILRGVEAVYTPFDSAVERGSRQIKGHLSVPIFLYVLWEMCRLNVPFSAEHRLLLRNAFVLTVPGARTAWRALGTAWRALGRCSFGKIVCRIRDVLYRSILGKVVYDRLRTVWRFLRGGI